MGDTLNEYSGGLGFSHTDVSLPGNSALPVAVGRVLATGTRQTTLGSGRFGDWDIDIPHLHTVALQNNPAWYGRAAYPIRGAQTRERMFLDCKTCALRHGVRLNEPNLAG